MINDVYVFVIKKCFLYFLIKVNYYFDIILDFFNILILKINIFLKNILIYFKIKKYFRNER